MRFVIDGRRFFDEPVEGSIHHSLSADAIEWQIQGVELIERHPTLVHVVVRLADVSELVECVVVWTS